METAPQEYNAVTLRQKYPCLHLLRAFRLALDLRRLLLGTVAVSLLALGSWLIVRLPFAPDGASENHRWVRDFPATVSVQNGVPTFQELFGQATNWSPVLAPVYSFLGPVFSILDLKESSLNNWAYGWTSFFWALLIGVTFGGAISRQVAVEFATDQKISLRETIGFTRKYFVSYFTSPLLPILGIGFFWLICFGAGLFGRIPGVGPMAVGFLYFIPLIFGFLMTLLLAGFAIGFPFMVTTISTEASDSFDGFSRSFNFLYSRTLYLAGLVIFALVLGALSLWIVSIAASWVVDLSAWGIKSGMGEHNTSMLLEDSPKLPGSDIARLAKDREHLVDTSLGAPMATFWMSAFNLLLHGFIVSFFWTSATVIYFLLRKSDDGTGLNEVYWEESEKPDQPFPVVEADAQDGKNLDDTVDANTDEGDSNSSEEEAKNSCHPAR